MPHKLSEAQRRVLEAMRDGAVLRKENTFTGGVWLDHPNGPFETVRHSTYFKLWKLKYIEGEYRFPTSTYELTEAGRAALQQSVVVEGE